MVNENAFGVGVSAIPSPITDVFWDGWMVYETGTVKSIAPIGGGIIVDPGVSGTAFSRMVIDSKAMRKIKFSDVLVGKFEVDNEVATSIIEAELSTRLLVKLS